VSEEAIGKLGRDPPGGGGERRCPGIGAIATAISAKEGMHMVVPPPVVAIVHVAK
jgi:hypothetical protein